jgi:hypothetical protein
MGKGRKRKYKGSPGDEESLRYDCQRPNDLAADVNENVRHGEATARVDPSTGLRSAFPGLEANYNNELFYGPALDGLDYLRMVR